MSDCRMTGKEVIVKSWSKRIWYQTACRTLPDALQNLKPNEHKENKRIEWNFILTVVYSNRATAVTWTLPNVMEPHAWPANNQVHLRIIKCIRSVQQPWVFNAQTYCSLYLKFYLVTERSKRICKSTRIYVLELNQKKVAIYLTRSIIDWDCLTTTSVSFSFKRLILELYEYVKILHFYVLPRKQVADAFIKGVSNKCFPDLVCEIGMGDIYAPCWKEILTTDILVLYRVFFRV